ncbi:LysR family transcriptional regulator [soil metagenome]
MALNPWRLHLLDVFERLGTVRAVAAELLLSPSTVSQQFTVLESETGLQLFERAGRSLTLTAAGLLLVDRARELRDHMDTIEAELAEIATTPAGHVRLGGFASSVSSLLIPAVHRLAHSHPQLQVELLEIEPRDAINALHQGLCDLIVTVDEADGALLSPSIAVAPLTSDPLMVVLPPGHPLVSRATISLIDLAQEPWALDLPGTYLGEFVPRECRLAGFEPEVAARFSSYGVMLSHVAAGLSVAVLPQLAIPPGAGVIALPVTGLANRRIVSAVRTGAARRSALASVMGALQEVAAHNSGRPG